MRFNILIVDDEKNIREGLGKTLKLDGYNVLLAENGEEAYKVFCENEIDLVIADLRMPKLSGDELLKKIAPEYPTVNVIILTGYGTIEAAVQAMKYGAYDFLTKPINMDHFSLVVKRALEKRELILMNRRLQQEIENYKSFDKIIGKSAQMQRISEIVNQVSPTKASVLITGESGVGKELVADAIHFSSPRKEKPFIKVHCAALTESLLQSELFGHEKGSFTGAISKKKGRFELADGGTIFLDEIGEINQNVQIKILRVLQEKKFERVGGEETIEVNVRIIAATNRDLLEEIKNGTFREDLYYRLNVVNINIPPLRERREDLSLLINAFFKEFVKENNKQIKGIDPKAMSALDNYSWPGNVRELRNCIESAVVLCKSNIITIDDLPSYIKADSDNYLKLSIGLSLAEIEKEIIRNTLVFYNGNKSKTATILGIGRKTLHRKIKEYGLN